jgi:hypothetical protein
LHTKVVRFSYVNLIFSGGLADISPSLILSHCKVFLRRELSRQEKKKTEHSDKIALQVAIPPVFYLVCDAIGTAATLAYCASNE